MLRTCQSRIAFSQSKWYASAINKVFKPIVLAHLRHSSAAVAAVPDDDDHDNHLLTIHQQQQNDLVRSNVFPMDNYRRCEGFRIYDGGRCQRLVRIDPHDRNSPTFCFNHHPNPQFKKQKQLKKKRSTPELKRIQPIALPTFSDNTKVKESVLVKPPEKVFDCWDLWLSDNMKKDVRENILKEMLKPVNPSEKPGYIYVYSLQKGPRVSGKGHAYFKIGRTINPHRRMYQVHNMCDHEPKIIELFPSFPQSQSSMMATNLETIDENTTIADFPKCPLPHRVEKLIHLELFGSFKKAAFKCARCGKEHREWIRVNRVMHREEQRPLTDHELWFSRIRPVILKWIQYGVLASAMANTQPTDVELLT